MDIINFYARLYGVDNRTAIEQLARRLPSNITQKEKPPIVMASLATLDLWDLPAWLEATGREVAGMMEWVKDPDNPNLMRAFLPVREVAK